MARVAVAVACALFSAVAIPIAFAAEPLFPTPLHITRQVQDPISGKTAVLDEYGHGNRLVSVRGHVTAIADYDKGELTEIDREAGTYSITRFDQIAKAASAIAGPSASTTQSAKATKSELRSVAARATRSGRAAEFYAATVDKQNIEVGVDRSVMLTREALEVLVGAAYPGTRRPEHEVFIAAAAPARLRMESTAAGGETRAVYALPIEQTIRYDIEGQQLEIKASVVRVSDDAPPADLLAIPPGARRVDSRIVQVNKELEQLANPTLPVPRR